MKVFTGIIQDVGTVRGVTPRGGDTEFVFAVDRLPLAGVRPGDSIAVNGVCLTATRVGADEFAADVSRETLAVTTLAELASGTRVNLEPALRAGDALGGHLVSGHVDGVAEVLAIEPDARSVRVTIGVPRQLARYIARKGSVAVDGVSLTVNGVDGEVFDVNLVPHTQSVTTLGAWAPGRRVNLEVDQVARYVERLIGR
ncbi:MAG TPA: riboflavin synthase [Steroidobacteraceae bacterium]|nr:riboflavin synthase [Steroidobacteraceae bacterium]